MSHTMLNYHIVFSTKDRRPLLLPDRLPRLREYAGGIIRNLGGDMKAFNGPADHVHITTRAVPTIAVADFVRDIKANCSRWLHRQFPDMKDFAWQDGYATFTVSRSGMKDVKAYIQRQQEHHKKKTFQEELIEALEYHEIEYDKRYIWK